MKVMPDSMPSFRTSDILKNITYYNGTRYTLYKYNTSYAHSEQNLGRISCTNIYGDTLYLKVTADYFGSVWYDNSLEFEVIKFQEGKWDTTNIPINIPFSATSNYGLDSIPLIIPLK
jgi:hypothetical protein